ncbi:XRE family transcriptional regulator [Neisseria meningitidis]|nr:XRE family transcriptional regulator [Neisseria meningitidis]MBW3912702.1 XRE family transcriptional regulator [Neisseria meningitidis]MBW3918665.1 XRE family transcriptional regulator [Neisseria meningitidis]
MENHGNAAKIKGKDGYYTVGGGKPKAESVSAELPAGCFFWDGNTLK